MVTFDFKRPPILTAGMVILLAVLAKVLFWAVEAPRRRFEYMVAGTFAAAILLTLVYLVLARRRLLPGLIFRIARRSEQSS
jgi:hypothetical protein